ncbi:MAG TPA: ATP-grasp domain-containing protein [Jatrophihabitans sp.]|nr:ATP-grasp domain-containing protein [Jatrophihabitans sp.]
MTTSEPTGRRPRLLLIGTGLRAYREYLLSSLGKEFRLHLFHKVEPGWEMDHLAGWTVLPDTTDGAAMAEQARRLDQDEPFVGVLCWDEARIHAAAQVAQALGLPNGDPAVIGRLRDKGQTRQALAAAGLAQPRSIPVATLAQALAAAEQVGYPAILKPRGLGASLGVIRVNDADQLRARFDFTFNTRSPEPEDVLAEERVLVEECVTGEEISVDAVITGGKTAALFIARKVVGYPPYAEEIGHYVSADDPLLTDPVLTELLQACHTALGFTDGWTHSEFMLTESGPKVIEVNGRLGGDLIPKLGMLATGIDPGVTAARAACGLPVQVSPTRRRTAGVRFFYVEQEDSEIVEVSFDSSKLPETVREAVAVAKPGAIVSPPPKGTAWGRIAFAIAVADSADECERALDAAGEAALEVKCNEVVNSDGRTET